MSPCTLLYKYANAFDITFWFVAQLEEAYVFPANNVPVAAVEVLNKPMFEIFRVAVTNEFALAN